MHANKSCKNMHVVNQINHTCKNMHVINRIKYAKICTLLTLKISKEKSSTSCQCNQKFALHYLFMVDLDLIKPSYIYYEGANTKAHPTAIAFDLLHPQLQ